MRCVWVRYEVVDESWSQEAVSNVQYVVLTCVVGIVRCSVGAGKMPVRLKQSEKNEFVEVSV